MLAACAVSPSYTNSTSQGGGQSASLLAVQFSVPFFGACFLDRFL